MYFKKNGDGLGLSEYNAIISLFRNDITLSSPVKLKNSSGEYGNYSFNINAVLTDVGYLLNNDSVLHCEVEPVYDYSTYMLQLTLANPIIEYDNIEDKWDYSTIELKLIENSNNKLECNVDLSSYENYILLNPVNMIVKFDKPVVKEIQ